MEDLDFLLFVPVPFMNDIYVSFLIVIIFAILIFMVYFGSDQPRNYENRLEKALDAQNQIIFKEIEKRDKKIMVKLDKIIKEIVKNN